MSILTVVLSSFVGTLGFAMILHTPARTLVPASVIGAAAYGLYFYLESVGCPEPAAIFLGTLFGTLLGQECARRMRRISTIFTTLAIVSLVPGLGLYRCMELLGSGESDAGLLAGVSAMITIAMITLGIAVGTYLFRLIIGSHGHPMPDR